MHDEFIVFLDLLSFFNLFCVNSCTYKSVADLIKPLHKRESSPIFKCSKSYYIYVYRHIDHKNSKNSYHKNRIKLYKQGNRFRLLAGP